MVIAEILTAKQESFSQHWAVHRSGVGAYRHAYETDGMKAQCIANEASKLLRNRDVASRIEELMAAANTVIIQRQALTIERMLDENADIAFADPSELTQWRIGCCRRCYGEDHRHQWKEFEYIEALERWEAQDVKAKAVTPMPDVAGGFGYDQTVEPNPACPACRGEGEGRMVMMDTRKLSPRARKLYRGVKQTRNGVEIEVADQDKARDNVVRMLGGYKDGLKLTGGIGVLAGALPTDPLEAERVYRAMIEGAGA